MNACKKNKESENKKDRKSIVGAIFITIGLVLLGRNVGILPHNISRIIFSWPTALIAIGTILIIRKNKPTGGLIMICFGGLFMWDKIFELSPMDWKIAWPTAFILAGLALVFSYYYKPDKRTNQPKRKKGKYDDVEFDIDKIEPIED